MNNKELLRTIPAVEIVLSSLHQDQRFEGLQHDVLVQMIRQATQSVREELLNASADGPSGEPADTIFQRIVEKTVVGRDVLFQASLRKVINATGVVLHTNLGRAPLSERARERVQAVMEGYSTLEYDLNEGGRGERYSHVSQRLEKLTGAEAAIVVNNNAAAVLLTLAGLAKGREVIVSRGELVEIGGSFRIPDVIRQSGAVMVEVGTTNKTHLRDYEDAITANTAAILKVHTSNFEIIGFTSQPSFAQVCGLARARGLITINDVGSGTLLPLALEGHREPTVQECISAGFDLVTFSGDKLLGAGQAGIIAGRKRYVDHLKREPLLRAIRIDKLSLAALEGTLIDYSTGFPEERIPGWAMLNMSEAELKRKAQSLASQLAPLEEAGWKVSLIRTVSLSGGGSLPAVELHGWGLGIVPSEISAAKLERRLRGCAVPVIALVRDDAVVIDVRCLLPGDEEILAGQIRGQLVGAEA